MVHGISTPSGSITFVQVESGTRIRRGTQTFTVTDEACIFAERHCYVTPDIYRRISAEAARAQREERECAR